MKSQIALADSDISYARKKENKQTEKPSIYVLGVKTITPLGKDFLSFSYTFPALLLPINTDIHTFNELNLLFLIVANNSFSFLENCSKSLD